MGAQWKSGNPSNLQIVSLTSALKLDNHDAGVNANVVACEFAPSTPYRVLIELLFSSGQAGFKTFRLSLASKSPLASAQIETTAPTPRPK